MAGTISYKFGWTGTQKWGYASLNTSTGFVSKSDSGYQTNWGILLSGSSSTKYYQNTSTAVSYQKIPMSGTVNSDTSISAKVTYYYAEVKSESKSVGKFSEKLESTKPDTYPTGYSSDGWYYEYIGLV